VRWAQRDAAAGAVAQLLETCVRESGVDMSLDTRSKFAVDKDALLQSCISTNEWQRLATSFFDPVASLPMGKSMPTFVVEKRNCNTLRMHGDVVGQRVGEVV
jgi:hypothetical protein